MLGKLENKLKEISNVVQALILGAFSTLLAFILFLDFSNSFAVEEIPKGIDFYFMPLMYSLITGVFSFFGWLVGKKSSDKVGFNLDFRMTKRELKINILIGVLLALFAIIGTEFFFLMQYPSGFNLIKEGFCYTLQSGFFEEVWYRMGLMGVFSYSIHKLFFKGKEEKKSTSRKIGLFVISLLLIFIALQDINVLLMFESIQIIVGLIVRIVPALVYTFLFYKEGFYHSVVAHMTQEMVINFILIPLITLIR